MLSFIVARTGGAEILGQFTVFLSLLGALSILSRLGHDIVLIRAVARYGQHDKIAVNLLVSTGRKVVPFSILVALFGAALLSSGLFGAPYPNSVVSFAVSLPMFTGLALLSGYLKGSGRAWIATIFEIGGLSMVASLLIGVGYLINGAVSAQYFPLILTFSLFLLLILGGFLLWNDAKVEPAEQSDEKAIFGKGAVEFTVIALSTFLIQAGAFLLAAPFLSAEALGLVRGAERLALVVSFPVLAIGPVIMPHIVRAAAAKEVAKLRHLIGLAMLVGAAIGLVPLVAMLAMPERILGLFGAEFAEVGNILRILALTHFAFLLLAPFVELLNMGGGERASMWISIGSFIAALLLFPLMSHFFGMNGFIAAYVIIMLGRGGIIVATSLRLHPGLISGKGEL